MWHETEPSTPCHSTGDVELVLFLQACLTILTWLTMSLKRLAFFFFFLEEKPSIPQEHSHLHLHSKGFFPEIEVQDFPVRGKAVYLRIKRRRWEDPETGQTYSRD